MRMSWELLATVAVALVLTIIIGVVMQTHSTMVQQQLEAEYVRLSRARQQLLQPQSTAHNEALTKLPSSSMEGKARRNILLIHKRIEVLVKQAERYPAPAVSGRSPSWLNATLAKPSIPPPSRAVHALLYHGAYFRVPTGPDGKQTHAGSIKCSDYFQTRTNHEEHLHRPLRAISKRLYIFLHTFQSGCPARDAALIGALRPVRYKLDTQRKQHKIVESYLASLRLLRESKVKVDFVTLTRFDLYFRVALSSLPIDWGHLNINWRAEAISWHTTRATSDLFLVMPYRFVDAYEDALVWSGNVPQSAGTLNGAAHWVYEPLAKDLRVGERNISFMQEGHYVSTQDVKSATQKPGDDVFIAILRSCPTRVERTAGGAIVVYAGLQCRLPNVSTNLLIEWLSQAPAAMRINETRGRRGAIG